MFNFNIVRALTAFKCTLTAFICHYFSMPATVRDYTGHQWILLAAQEINVGTCAVGQWFILCKLYEDLSLQLLPRFTSPSDWKWLQEASPNHTWFRATESDLRPLNISLSYANSASCPRWHGIWEPTKVWWCSSTGNKGRYGSFQLEQDSV